MKNVITTIGNVALALVVAALTFAAVMGAKELNNGVKNIRARQAAAEYVVNVVRK